MGIRYYSHTGVNTEYLFLSFPSLGYFLHTHVLVSTLINILGIQLVYIWTFYYVQLFLSLPLSTQSLNSVFTNQKIFWVPFWFLSFQLGNCLEAGGAIKCLCHVLPFLRDYFPSFYNTLFQKPIVIFCIFCPFFLCYFMWESNSEALLLYLERCEKAIHMGIFWKSFQAEELFFGGITWRLEQSEQKLILYFLKLFLGQDDVYI